MALSQEELAGICNHIADRSAKRLASHFMDQPDISNVHWKNDGIASIDVTFGTQVVELMVVVQPKRGLSSREVGKRVDDSRYGGDEQVDHVPAEASAGSD